MRVKIVLAYNGKEFYGSQIQKETPKTVLGTLIHVLVKLGIKTIPIASGRTDRGVHASAQVCHLDIPSYWSNTLRLQQTLNKMLPSSIHIKKISLVDDAFHARYSAKKRTYRYIIKCAESSPFLADFVTFLPTVDFHQLSLNIKLFEGEHDFVNFIKKGSDEKSTVRHIYKSFAYKHKGYIILYFEANGFLRSQIRMMVGALLTHTQKEIVQNLNNEKRDKIKPAPPNGLYLAKITY
jgi:tRNA pseudouridine38-40 synthase